MFGEIYLCQFPYTSDSAGKICPALVLVDLHQNPIICRVTSLVRAGILDVSINDWQADGLLKPSTARLDWIVPAEKSVFIRQLGVLGAMDMDALRKIWNEHMTL